MDKKELLLKIENQKRKVEEMNRFSERMHFLDDEQVVEMYKVIHKEEQILAALIEKLEMEEGKKEKTGEESKI